MYTNLRCGLDRELGRPEGPGCSLSLMKKGVPFRALQIRAVLRRITQ